MGTDIEIEYAQSDGVQGKQGIFASELFIK